MSQDTISEFVMENMPENSGSRSKVTVGKDGISVEYQRPYSPRWGFGGWSAAYVKVGGKEVAVSSDWKKPV